jgi:hypothetical protein
MDAPELLAAAKTLMQRPDVATAGIWPRATALLARRALETALDEFWRQRAPAIEQCSMRAQMLCLPSFLGGREALAEEVSFTWVGLSRACHHHAYELAPTASELTEWLTVVERLVSLEPLVKK